MTATDPKSPDWDQMLAFVRRAAKNGSSVDGRTVGHLLAAYDELRARLDDPGTPEPGYQRIADLIAYCLDITDLEVDVLRVRHQFTLFAEAHAGHSNDGGGARRVRPIGSSLFLRWPEFGFGIAPHKDASTEERPSLVEVKHWRGSRDERAWPHVLRHGSHLPWEPTGDYFRMLAERDVA